MDIMSEDYQSVLMYLHDEETQGCACHLLHDHSSWNCTLGFAFAFNPGTPRWTPKVISSLSDSRGAATTLPYFPTNSERRKFIASQFPKHKELNGIMKFCAMLTKTHVIIDHGDYSFVSHDIVIAYRFESSRVRR